MFDWSNYGKIVRSYNGSGSLYFENHEVGCSFELVQLFNGTLSALCKISDKTHLLFMLYREPSKLVGETEQGHQLTFSENMIVTSIQDDKALIHGRFVNVKPKKQPNTGCFIFPLTNLVLDGNFKISLGGYKISCNPINDYHDAMTALKASKGITITSEVTVQANSITDRDEVVAITNNICMLLTLARGCRVSWLYYDFATSDGSIHESFHGSAITKPFTSLPLIPANSAIDTKHFIEETYGNLLKVQDFWNLRNAIDAYTDAKVEGDFLEARALKLAILMEHLKSQYLTKKDKEYILHPPAAFDSSVKKLIKIVHEILLLKFPDHDRSKLEMMANHVRGLNWFPFGRALSEICNCIGMPTNKSERRKFIDIRNELVHHFRFHPNYGTSWNQFAYLMTFLGKIFLAILKYNGDYYDWTNLGQGEAAMRAKMETVDVTRYY
jgi:hypothetical protein